MGASVSLVAPPVSCKSPELSIAAANGRAPVFELFRAGRPSAVLFTIWAIVVDSVNRKSGRSLPHIFKKLTEFLPSFADRDSSASVVAPRRSFWTRASANHGMPNIVGTCSGHSMLSKTSARLCESTSQLARWNFSEISAGAFTQPSSALACICRQSSDGGQLTKYLVW